MLPSSLVAHQLGGLTPSQLADLRRQCLPRRNDLGEDAFSQALLIADQKFNLQHPRCNIVGFIRTIARRRYLNLLQAERVGSFLNLDPNTLGDCQVKAVLCSRQAYIDPAKMDFYPPAWVRETLDSLTAMAQDQEASEGERLHAYRARLVLLDLIELVRADAIGGLSRTDLTEFLRQRLNLRTGQPISFSTFQATLTLLRQATCDVIEQVNGVDC